MVRCEAERGEGGVEVEAEVDAARLSRRAWNIKRK